MTFGAKLLALRRARNWTQEELADKIGVTRQALSKWEANAALPDTKNVVAIARLFGVATDYLLCEDEGRELEANVSNTQNVPRRVSPLTLAGGFLLAIGATGALCIGLLASIYPKAFGDDLGVKAFLRYYNIEWFFCLLVVSAIAGAALLVRRAAGKKRGESESIQAEIRAMREKEATAQKREVYECAKRDIRAALKNGDKKDSEGS